MSLSRAQNMFMPVNINSIVLFWVLGIPGEKLLQQGENQQQIQPSYSWNRIQATLVGCELSHHCANPALKNYYDYY